MKLEVYPKKSTTRLNVMLLVLIVPGLSIIGYLLFNYSEAYFKYFVFFSVLVCIPFLSMLLKSLKKQPTIQMDETGIKINLPKNHKKIFWSEIEKIEYQVHPAQKLILIKLVDSDKYYSKLNVFNLFQNNITGGSKIHFEIIDDYLDYPLPELEKILKANIPIRS